MKFYGDTGQKPPFEFDRLTPGSVDHRIAPHVVPPIKAEDIIRDLCTRIKELEDGFGVSREMFDHIRETFGAYKFETQTKLEEQALHIEALEEAILRPDSSAARYWRDTIKEERAAKNG